MRFFHKDSDKKRKNRKFHPLRRQIAVLFIGLLLLSMVVITLINGLFLEHYYISRKTEVLKEAVEKLENLEVETDSDGNSSAEVSDEMFKDCSENNLTWVMVTADGQTICSVGSNEDLCRPDWSDMYTILIRRRTRRKFSRKMTTM